MQDKNTNEKKSYESPTLEKRERLVEVTEGSPDIVGGVTP